MSAREHNEPHPDYPQGCRSVVCGAHNFAVGDLVVVSLPGAVLAGGFAIAARKTYGHVSDGMICAEDELGIGHDHTGIIVLPAHDGAGRPLEPGDDPAGVLHLRDDVLDIDVSPDIGYCLSIRGLAREAGQNLGRRFTDVIDKATPAAVADGYPVRLDDAACPLFVALTVTGIDPSRPSPRWLARRLVMAGMRSISLAVDITNYVMLETGQPLHAYDASLLSGPIVVRKARAGETLVTLDDVTRTLAADDLLITDDTGAIGLAGVMGGQSTEVRETTTDVVIEAANFDPVTISHTLRRHNLPSEASKRFHRGVDPNAAYSAAHLAARLLVELAGGTLAAAETVAGALPSMPSQTIDAGLPSAILGVDVATERVVEILRESGCVVTVGCAGHAWPSFRQPGVPTCATRTTTSRRSVARSVSTRSPPSCRPRRLDGGCPAARPDGGRSTPPWWPPGSSSCSRSRSAPPRTWTAWGCPAMTTAAPWCVWPIPWPRPSPTCARRSCPGLFAAVNRNTSRGNDDLALYESGTVFLAGSGEAAPIPSVEHRPTAAELAAIEAALPRQPLYLAAVLCGQWRRAGWEGPSEPAGWRQAFAFAEVAAGAVGAHLERRQASLAPWHPGRCAALVLDGEVIGHAGELHPDVVRAFGLPVRTAAVELDLDALLRLSPEGGVILPVSGHPVAKEDVALVVADSVSAADVQRGPHRGCGRAAGVDQPVRRVHRRAGAGRAPFAGIRPAVPRDRPYPHRRRDGGSTRVGRGARRRTSWGGPAHLLAGAAPCWFHAGMAGIRHGADPGHLPTRRGPCLRRRVSSHRGTNHH